MGWKGVVKILMPTQLPGGVIDGTTVEVAQCGDLWIPMGEDDANIKVEQKGHISRPNSIDGFSITASNGDAHVIAGKFKIPSPDQLPITAPSLAMMRRDEIELLLRVAVFQLGGQLSSDGLEFNEVKQAQLEVVHLQDPYMVKVNLK